MRAWVLRDDAASYELDEVADPLVGPREVKVTLRSSALNHLDLWVARRTPAPPSYPHVPGAGVVLEVGAGVDDLAPGDEIVIDPATSCGICPACRAGDEALCPDLAVLGEHRWGTHAETVVVPRVNAVAKPAGLAWEVAASVGLVLAGAVRIARRGRVTAATSVLVVGVGGGSAAAAFEVVRAIGARSYVTSSSERARAWARDRGARGAFDSAGAFEDEIRAATEGRGVDVVIDNVGSATFERSFASLARGGRLVMNGSTTGRAAELPLPRLFWRQLEVIGASMNGRDEFAEALRLASNGTVTVPIEAPLAFDRYPVALERLAAGEHLGKLVLNHEGLGSRI
jgi:D-arabinose 1-dehydrogenase-like Zn-dependent alcohol dehydrogenase